MYRILPVLLLGATAFAQTDVPQTEKPPAALEQALKARVNQIYTFWHNEDYRKAEAMIAEDTKDYYYSGAKPQVKSFSVLEIQFFDDFTRAKAITQVTEPLVVAGFPPGDMTVKMPTLWKVEDGQWVLYVDFAKLGNPTGVQNTMQKAVDAANAANGAAPKTPPGMPVELPKTADFVMGKVVADKNIIDITPGGTVQVEIVNRAAGPMTLSLGYPLKGMEIKLDKTDLKAGDKAILTFKAGDNPVAGPYSLQILPTWEILNVTVRVKK